MSTPPVPRIGIKFFKVTLYKLPSKSSLADINNVCFSSFFIVLPCSLSLLFVLHLFFAVSSSFFIDLRHSLLIFVFSVVLHRSLSFFGVLRRSSSFFVVLHRSLSFFVVLCCTSSFFFGLRHSSSSSERPLLVNQVIEELYNILYRKVRHGSY